MERPVNKKDKVEFNKEAQAGRRNTTRKALLWEKQRENHRIIAFQSHPLEKQKQENEIQTISEERSLRKVSQGSVLKKKIGH